ncbi:hypothetical protein [Nonlabens xiamenensis]|uniref:hypothetical protein n=1 Tax=Nonlabens xiamenensis TaxID=2341043 RepID=UPI000F605DC0|nr:hypothetical protein [Nonlabens xiamenensis]
MNSALQLPQFLEPKDGPRSENRFGHKLYRSPFMEGRDITTSMTINYRILYDQYASHCEEFNIQVDNYNAERERLEESKTTRTELRQKSIMRLARKKKARKHDPDPTAWNELIHEFNVEHGTNYLLERKQPLKQSYDVLLSVLLKYYCAQLTAHVAKRRQNNLSLVIPLPALETNSDRILRYKQDGLRQLSCDNRTVLRQIKRLEAAGILQFISHGARATSEIYFNPKLLNIQEKEPKKGPKKPQKPTPKPQESENSLSAQDQSSKDSECTKSTLLGGPLTRTLEILKERKEVSNFNDMRNGAKAPTADEPEQNQNTNCVQTFKSDPVLQNVKKINIPPALQKNETDPAARIAPKTEKNGRAQAKSIELLAGVQDVFTLSRKLSEHFYDHYEPIPNEDLQWEVQEGSLTRQDFKKVIDQEFLKCFARIYVGIDKHYQMKPYHWSKALQDIDKNLFKIFTGKVFSKQEILDQLKVYKRMIRMADYSFKKNTDYFPRFAYEYLWRGSKISFWNLEQRAQKIDRQTATRRAERERRMIKILEINTKIKSNRQMKRLRNDYTKARKAASRYLDPKNTEWTRERLDSYCNSELLKSVSKQIDRIIADVQFRQLPKHNP